jgi:hypothetical protein
MWNYASPLGVTSHEIRIGDGFMRAQPQSTGAIPRGIGLTWNGSNALGRVKAAVVDGPTTGHHARAAPRCGSSATPRAVRPEARAARPRCAV